MIYGKYNLLKHGTYDLQNTYSSTSDYLKGEICYSTDGSLSVLILFSPEIKSKSDILSYVGNFEVKSESTLIHHISLCSSEKKNKTSEERSYILNDDLLILGCLLTEGKRFEAVWKKI